MRSFIFSLALVTAVSGTMISADAATTNDEETAQYIAKSLKESGKLKDYRVGVKYEDGVAWLMGTVTSHQQKQMAEEIARQSAGVDHIVSKLEVEAPEGESIADGRVQPASKQQPVRRQQPQRAPRAPKDRRSIQNNMPVPYARTNHLAQSRPVQPANFNQAQYAEPGYMQGGSMPPQARGPQPPRAGGAAVSYDNPQLPGYAWPSYAASPNYAALSYPKQYSASAWPYIGPFYPYPQVPLGWRKVTLEWDDGFWNLDFADSKGH